jgi:hypothetical protein
MHERCLPLASSVVLLAALALPAHAADLCEQGQIPNTTSRTSGSEPSVAPPPRGVDEAACRGCRHPLPTRVERTRGRPRPGVSRATPPRVMTREERHGGRAFTPPPLPVNPSGAMTAGFDAAAIPEDLATGMSFPVEPSPYGMSRP